MVTNFVAQFGILLCCIGFFPAAFWSMCVAGWALGGSRGAIQCWAPTGYAGRVRLTAVRP